MFPRLPAGGNRLEAVSDMELPPVTERTFNRAKRICGEVNENFWWEAEFWPASFVLVLFHVKRFLDAVRRGVRLTL